MSGGDDKAAMLLRQAQLWLELLVPIADVDPEATVINVKAVTREGETVLSRVSLADTMTALQLFNGPAMTDVAGALNASGGDGA